MAQSRQQSQAQVQQTPKPKGQQEGQQQDAALGNGEQAAKLVATNPGDAGGGNPAGGPTAKQNAAAKDLGTVKKVDGSFAQSAGSLLEGLVPKVGDEASAKLDIKIPVNPAASVTVSFGSKVSRDAKGYKLGVNVGVGFRGEVDAWIATAFAEAKVNGYMEAGGDSVVECFNLLILALHQAVKSVSTDAADWMFNGKEMAKVIQGMDQDDYVKAGIQVSGKAGVTSGGKDTGAGITGDFSTKLTKDAATGGLKSTSATDVTAEISSATQWGAWKGSIKGSWENGKFKKITLGGEVELSAKFKDLSDPALIKTVLVGMASGISDAVAACSGKFNGNKEQALLLARFVKQTSATGLLIDAGAVAAMKKAGASASSADCKLVVKAAASYDMAKGPGFSIEFAKKSGFTISAGGAVKVALESVSSIAKLQAGAA